MREYHNLMKKVLGKGSVQYEPRTEEYILGVSSGVMEYDLREEFPLVTTKNVPPRLPFEELFWKMRGERNVKPLFDRNIHIWDANGFERYLKTEGLRDEFPKHSEEWNSEFARYQDKLAQSDDPRPDFGDLGPVYGFQWRSGFERDGEPVDQLKNVLDGINNRPGSRYHILNAWNPGSLPDMALGPCPFWHQFTVYEDGLDLTMAQRSCDVYLGVPFNIAQDSLLTHMIAKESDLEPRKFNHHLINLHAYLGVPPRANFWTNRENVESFQSEFNDIKRDRERYLELREWYLETAPPESAGNESKDHIPYILEQLSKEPRELPELVLQDIPLFDAIEMPVKEVAEVVGYNPHRWKAKAVMAA